MHSNFDKTQILRISVVDLETMTNFYEKKLGWRPRSKLLDEDRRYEELGREIHFLSIETVESHSPDFLEVYRNDLERYSEFLTTKGVENRYSVEEKFIQFQDPENNVIQVIPFED